MKKMLLLFVFCCVNLIAFAQSTTIVIYATGTSGTFKTGNATATARTDGNIVTTSTTRRGYAVFDLSALPPGATVTSTVVGFNVATYAGTGTPSGWNTYGYAGDLSLVTTAATLFADMTSGTSLTTATYGTGTGNQTLASTAATNTFVQGHIGSKVSLCWTGGNNRTYTITGETGTAALTGTHAPYMQVTYTCAGVSGVTATASPNPVCKNATLTLTGTGTGTISYSWAGPSAYSAATATATLTAVTASAGIYTLSAVNAAGCITNVTTAAVTVSALPAAITPTAATSICVGAATTLADASGAGTWASSASSIASVSGTGVVTGGAIAGVATITFTANSTGCSITKSVTVNGSPAAITGASAVCAGQTITLADPSGGGTWSSSPGSGSASVASATGIVTGGTAGTATITYTACGTPATYTVTVNPLPDPITGPAIVCEGGGTITLSDDITGGTWSALPSGHATASTLSTNTGLITGVTVGTATISYTSPLTCVITKVVTVTSFPSAISGALKECAGTTITLSDAVAGGSWSSNALSVATIDATTGVLTGASAGITIITYANTCGYKIALDTVVATPPPFVGRDSVCIGGTTAFASSVVGGTWSSSTPAKASVLSGSGLITGVSAGKAAITYTIPPGCIRVDSVTVLPLPAPITGTKHVCAGGGTTTLADATSGGTWASTRVFVATVGTAGAVTGIYPDTTLIVYTSPLGCSVSTMVTVNPQPGVIAGVETLCSSLKDTLYDATPGGTWSSASPSIATVGAATGIVSPVTGGTVVISYTTAANGCAATKTIHIHPKPVPSVTYNHYSTTFYTDTFYSSYQWHDSLQGLITGAIYPRTAAIDDGYYYVVVTDSTGCAGASAHVAFYDWMLGVPVPQNPVTVRIYPNPATEAINIECAVKVNVVISSIDGKKELEAMNVAGTLNIGSLPNGIHLLTVYDNNGQMLTVQKMIKQ